MGSKASFCIETFCLLLDHISPNFIFIFQYIFSKSILSVFFFSPSLKHHLILSFNSLKLLFVDMWNAPPTISFNDAVVDMSSPGWLWGSGAWFSWEQVFLIMASIALGRKDTEILPMQNSLNNAA